MAAQITLDYERMEHPPVQQQNSTTATMMTAKRVKANGYFLIGSILYLPPSIWDVISATNYNTDNNIAVDDDGHHDFYDDRSYEEELLYNMLVGAAILAYIGNGIVEIQIAYKDYEELQTNIATKTRQQDYVANATLFAVAAFVEMISIISLHTKWLIKISSQLYLLNALFTLWLSREADTSTISGKIVYSGDVLFLVGAIIDMIGGYLEMHDGTSPVLIAWAWLASSIAWFLDAICYLTAALLDHYYPQLEQQKAEESVSSKKELLEDNHTHHHSTGGIQMRDLPNIV